MKMSIKNNLNVLWIAVLTSMTFSPVASAYDTDIYFASTSAGSGVTNNHANQPNILFVLDTSGSMQWDMSDSDSRSRMSVLKNSMNSIIDSAQNVNMGIMRFSYEGGAVSYPVADINADAGLVESQQTTTPVPIISKGPFTINRSVLTSDGDAKEVSDFTKIVSINDPVLPATGALDAGGTPTTVTKTISVRIANGSDDGDERVGAWNRHGNYSNLNRGQLYTPTYTDRTSDFGRQMLAGFRFVNLDIPKGAVVTNARLKLRNKERGRGDVDWLVTVDKDPQSEPFISGVNDGITKYKNAGGSNVARDDSYDDFYGVNWAEGNVNAGDFYTSPNLKDLLNVVVENPAWDQANNAVSLFMWPWTSGNRIRRRDIYSGDNGTANNRPELIVTYQYDTLSPPTVKPHVVGFNFADLRIPQGATIKSAYLQVAAAKSGNSDASFKVYAETTDNSNSFTTGLGNVSNRNLSAGVTWDVPAAEGWTAGQFYESSDIGSIVQTVTDRAGWCGGNALSLILKGTGERAISSFDAGSALAPKIIVEYENDFSGTETGCTVNETSYQISESTGDADENQATSSVNTSSNSVRFGSAHWAGFNFKNILVPAKADVQQATLVLKSDVVGIASVRISAHDTANSSNFSSTPDNISTRNRTTTSQNWNAVSSAAGEVMVSSDFSSAIDEVVALPTWVSGGSISVVLERGAGALSVQSYDKSPFDSARLNLRYKYDLNTGSSAASGITVRQRLKEVVTSLPASGGTPATDTLYESIKYLKGDTVDWGHQRMPSYGRNYSSGATKRTSIAASYSPLDASVVLPSGCPGRDSNDSDCSGEYINASPLPKYVSPIVNSCQNTYVVLLSDGDPNSMVGESKIRTMTGASCPDGNDTTCGSSLATYMNKTDLLPTSLPGDQTVILHTIKFADSSDPAYLKALASAGGGNFYDATSADKLLDAFNEVVKTAVTKPQTFAAPSVAASAYNRLQSGDNLFYSMFVPHLTKRWEGNVKNYRFDPDSEEIVGQNDKPAFTAGQVSDESQSFWSDSTTIDGDKVDSGGFGERVTKQGHLNRKMYTYVGASSPSNTPVKDPLGVFESSNFRVITLPEWGTGVSALDRVELIDWVRGKDLDDSDGDGSKVDTRWSLGDPLHAQPVSITYDGGTDRQSSADDNVKVFIGTNAGVFHAFDGKTGEEAWAFVPPEMLALQQDMRVDANGDHIYGIDGRISTWVNDVNKDGDIKASDGDQVVLYIPFGRGARSLYAIDVTTFSAPKILWRIDNNTPGFANLGQTWSQPFIGNVDVGGTITNVLVMGGGYDTAYDSPSYNGAAGIGRGVYLVDAMTGKRLLWISSDASADLRVPGMDSAIPSPIGVVDLIGPDGVIDRLYFADLLGRMWRVDLMNVGVGSAGDSVAHKVADLNGVGNEAGRRFFNRPSVVPFSDEGEIPTYLYLLITSGDVHNPLYKQTLNAAFAIKDEFPLLDENNLPALLRLEKSDPTKGIFDVTTYASSTRPVALPHGYYFTFAQGIIPANVGIVGLQSGDVRKIVANEEVSYTWDFPAYDPNFNAATPADACSSSVVGRTAGFTVYLKDGVPFSNDPSVDPDCATCTSRQIISDPQGDPGGIAPNATTVGGKTTGGDVACVKVKGFTVQKPGENKIELCDSLNTNSAYWWRNR